MKKLVKESLIENDSKEEIEDLKQKIAYARMFHPEKVDIYLDRLAEIEGELPANTMLGNKMSREALQRDTEESDREYIKSQRFNNEENDPYRNDPDDGHGEMYPKFR